jgi:hypothetical protein
MVALILDRALADLRAPALERLLAAELPQPLMLDGFHLDPTRGHAVFATGPALTTHVLAGNVPGVAVTSVVRALLVKSASFAKTSHREPVLTPAFARALAHADPDLADCIAVSWWAGTDLQRTREAASAADAIVCYGGREAVDGIRSLAPRDALFLEHGPRISFGLVAREALISAESTRTTADAVARATALLDQQGCVSPQLVYVETSGHLTPKLFGRLVADRLMDLQDTLPRGTLDAAEAAAIHAFRASAEFREISGENIELIVPADTSFTVLFETDPTFLGTPLNRVLRIKEVSDLGIVPGLLHPFRTLLQTAAFAAPPARIAALAPRLVAAGVTRMTSFEDMPFPPPFWHHDGRGPLRELLRFSDLES